MPNKKVINFCLTCLRSHPHKASIDDENWLVLKCTKCKEEQYYEVQNRALKIFGSI